MTPAYQACPLRLEPPPPMTEGVQPGGSTFKTAKRVSEKVRLGEMQQSFFDKPIEDLDDDALERFSS
jgi:hypothetical protein